MSGGHFEYKQHFIQEIYNEIDFIVEKNGKEKTPEEINEEWGDSNWYENSNEGKFFELNNTHIHKLSSDCTLYRTLYHKVMRAFLIWLLPRQPFSFGHWPQFGCSIWRC